MLFRRSIEVLSRGFVFKRHLPARYGGRPFYASPEGGLKYFRWKIENIDPMLLSASERLVTRGDVVWDVGANVGMFSFAAAGLAGRIGKVFSMEPDLCLVKLLRRSAKIPTKDSAPVTVLPVAVSNKVSLEGFNIAERARASNALVGFGATTTGGVREQQTVVTVTLDWLLDGKISPPTVVKIDAEGAELNILRGAPRLLSDIRPKILVEVSNENAEEVTKLLFRAQYELFDADNPNEPVDLATWNTLALPINNAY